ncbi:hypothetical protein QJS04_geneDACA008553 [Acorus gramineus]|uniref:TLDc domain-containing protein n=1 Tax=Acorus gramineus TaxID=55184 RepID=A0AAV9AH26_ACOGR|nr:hypothetical protein QJS04_geneDACA008553 [Acorus gramineus]
MGNSQSPPADPRLASATRCFAERELDELRTLFVALASQSRSNSKFISPSVFKSYFRIPGSLGDRMFDLVTQKRNDGMLTFEDLVIAKGTYEKGSRDEIEQFIYQLVDVMGDGVVGRSDLEVVLTSMLDAVFNVEDGEHSVSSHQGVVDIFLNVATFSEEVEGHAEKCMSFTDIRKWWSVVPSARKFLGSLLMQPDPGSSDHQVPNLLISENISPEVLLMKKEYAWHIAGALSQPDVEEWKLLYHSSIHGLSFSTFLGNISNGGGPTVLLIKDTDGYIYGGYASQPWEKHSDFYGDMKSFIFHIYPQASIYKPSGANTNLQWCAVNFSSESIPNGIGFGGRINHFGLFLSASFDQGHTFSCTTFNSPCLSKTSRICPEVIECWGVVANGIHDEKNDNVIKGTVLERFKEDRNMLNMVGIANSSE